MKPIRIIALFLAVSAYSSADTIADLLPQIGMMTQLEKLSSEGRYAEIFDNLGREYRRGVDKKSWVKRSEEIGWVITKAQIGTFTEYRDFADAPVKSDTVIGQRISHVHAVAYFVREGGTWHFWNFPFVPNALTDRPTWPPPMDQPNQAPEPTALLVTPRADARVAPSNAVAHL